jgi:hypothetical protein
MGQWLVTEALVKKPTAGKSNTGRRSVRRRFFFCFENILCITTNYPHNADNIVYQGLPMYSLKTI